MGAESLAPSKINKFIMITSRTVLSQIKEMFLVDQDLRFQASNADLSKKFTGSKLNWGLLNFLVYILDGVHNQKIAKIINEHGYPTHKMIGRRGMFYFSVLIIHQDSDINLQKKCLEFCDFSPKDKAYLTDRVLVNSGQKQIYGTQFQLDNDGKKLIPRPLKNPQLVDKLRKEVGLKPLSFELKEINKRRRLLSKSKKSA